MVFLQDKITNKPTWQFLPSPLIMKPINLIPYQFNTFSVLIICLCCEATWSQHIYIQRWLLEQVEKREPCTFGNKSIQPPWCLPLTAIVNNSCNIVVVFAIVIFQIIQNMISLRFRAWNNYVPMESWGLNTLAHFGPIRK